MSCEADMTHTALRRLCWSSVLCLLLLLDRPNGPVTCQHHRLTNVLLPPVMWYMQGLTRVVAITPEQAAKAVQSIHLAGLMVNNQYVWKGGDALKQEQSGGQAQPADGSSDRQATLEDRPVTEAANETAAAAGAAGTGGRVVLFQPVMVRQTPQHSQAEICF